MNWQEVIKSKKEVTVKVTTIRFNKFSEERCIKFYSNMQDALTQLDKLGNGLTIDDYDKIIVLMDELNKCAASYRSMRLMESPENYELTHAERFLGVERNKETLLEKRLKEIDDGIKNYDTNSF